MATSNTLTAILPVLYEALDTVSREQIGMIGAVNKDSTVGRLAKGSTLKSHVVPAITAEDITPGAAPAASGGQTFTAVDVTISKSRAAPILWSGEEELALSGGDYPQLSTVKADQFAQAFRVLSNEMETDLVGLGAQASRAYGTSGTTPFATINEMDDIAEVYRILVDNGSPTTDLQFVLGAAAAAKIRGYQANLWKANEAGSTTLLREGEIGRIQKFMFRESGQIDTNKHTLGDGTGFVTDLGATLPVGSLTIHLDTGVNEVVTGDVVTFVGDTNQYVVKTGHDAGAGATEGDIVIEEPGLQQTLADGVAMTITGTYTGNMAFDRNALLLANRLPALPEGGDDAEDRMTIVDPVSGIPFEVAVYRQYRQVKIEIAAAWGIQAIKSEHLALLKG